MDALVALGDDGPDPEEHWAFRPPVTAGPRAVFLAREDDQRNAFGLVAQSSLVHRQDLAAWLDPGHPAPNALLLQKLILHARIAEHPAHHHFEIAAARCVLIEQPQRDVSLLQIVPGQTVCRD